MNQFIKGWKIFGEAFDQWWYIVRCNIPRWYLEEEKLILCNNLSGESHYD